MRPIQRLLLLLLAMIAVAAWAAGPVWVLRIDGTIGPATADYVHRSLAQAAEQDAELVVLQIDTPGGLDTSMRDIIQDILASSVPVAAYVSPSGARAASAGTYIVYASHVAAMAPGTNLGAATPVQIGGLPDLGEPEKGERKTQGRKKGQEGAGEESDEGAAQSPDTMKNKLVNDAAAYLRSLAEMRGRNADWAEQAVRASASISATDAAKRQVVDLLAPNLDQLLERLDGRKVDVQGQERTLHTRGATIRHEDPDWRSEILSIIANPNVAYVLMLLGIYGLIYELANPGGVLPGVAGTICLLLALYAFQVLPVNYAGLALMLLGLAFMVAEVFVPSFGALGIGGVIAFVIGSIILIDTDRQGQSIAWPLIAGVAVTSAGFMIGVLGLAVRSRRRAVVSGAEGMVGSIGRVISGAGEELRVHVRGENWFARASGPLREGQSVRVTGLHGLIVEVEPNEPAK